MADLHEYKESLSENLMQVIALLEEYGFCLLYTSRCV